jgi:hypothetical protein
MILFCFERTSEDYVACKTSVSCANVSLVLKTCTARICAIIFLTTSFSTTGDCTTFADGAIAVIYDRFSYDLVTIVIVDIIVVTSMIIDSNLYKEINKINQQITGFNQEVLFVPFWNRLSRFHIIISLSDY